MNKSQRARLEAAGFRIGDAAEFLGLSREESEIVELRVQLARSIRALRTRSHLSQNALASRIKSSQSRVAKIEAAAHGVSLDLYFKAYFAAGGKAPRWR